MRTLSNPSLYKNGQMMVRVGDTGNVFNLSSLKDFERSMTSHCFAIKFVRDGIERYTINNHSYTVNSGSYLLMNGYKEGRVIIDSEKDVKGMCLNISNELIADVISTIQAPDTPVSDPELSNFFHSQEFLENQYHAPHTELGRKLQDINNSIINRNFTPDHVNQELFYHLAEALVNDQVQVFKQLQSIKTVRNETQRDLCRRVLRGKEFIDSNYSEMLTIENIAHTAGMSEYHFFRLFKQVMGITPYQYILSVRLRHAALLLKADYSVSDVAVSTGFADIYSFSKAFKKHYKIPPTHYSTMF
jgi:AraC family transcriptional regulator